MLLVSERGREFLRIWRRKRPGTLSTVLAAASFLATAEVCSAQNPLEVGSVLLVRGVVTIRSAGAAEDRALLKEQKIYHGDVISSRQDGRALLLLLDRTQLKINENTTITITKDTEGSVAGATVIDLHKGEIWNRAEKSSATKVRTPVATAAIRGTSWFTKVNPDGSASVSVISGTVELANEFGAALAGENEMAIVEPGKKPTLLRVVPSKEGLQWVAFPQETLRYLYLVSDNVEVLRRRLSALDHQGSAPAADLERAEIYHDLGQFEQSLGILERVAGSPPDARASAVRAVVLMKKGQWSAAERILGPLVDSSLQSQIAHTVLSIHQNHFEEAAKILDVALREHGESVLLSATFAHLLLLRGDIEEATALCEKQTSTHQETSVLATILNTAYLISGELGKAGAFSAAMLQANPESALSHFDRAATLSMVAGRAQEAAAEYRKALALSPENPYVANSLGVLLTRMGNYEEALPLYERLVGLGHRNAELLYSYGLLLSQVDRDSDARIHYSLAREHEGSVDALFGEGISILKSGRSLEALEQLAGATALEPKLALNHVYLAVASYQLGRISEAISALNRAKESDPNDAVPYIVESYIWNDQYEPYKAMVASRKAFSLLKYRKSGELDFIKATKDGMANIGYSYQALGLDFWAAIKSHDIMDVDPYDPNAHLFPALVYTDVASPTAAQSEYAQGIIMDSSGIIEPNRNRPIIKIPSNYTTASLSVGSEGSGTSGLGRLQTSGYAGEPYKIDYLLEATGGSTMSLNRYNNGQFDQKATGDFDYRGVRSVVGWHPSYTTNLYARFEGNRTESDAKAYASVLSLPYAYFGEDTEEKRSFEYYEGGFHHRLSQDSHLLVRPYLIDVERESDSAGTLDPFSLHPTLPSAPASYVGETHISELGLQLKHMFTVDAHHVFYGLESFKRTLDTSTDANLRAAETFSEQTISENTSVEQKVLKVYLRDRWRAHPSLSVDAGVALQSNWISQQRETDSFTTCPRIGLDFTPTRKDAFRVAYQRNIIPFTFPSSGVIVGYHGNDILSGPGQLEPNDVAGLLPFEMASIGLYADMKDYRFRWEREWTESFLHFNELAYQEIAGVGDFKLSYFGINWVAHPRIGVQILHSHIFDINYEVAPFELDRVSEDYLQFKVTYVHPNNISATLYQEYFSPKNSYYPSLDDAEANHRTSLWITWESPEKKYAVKAQWIDVFGDRPNLTGLAQSDSFAFVQFEYRF